MSFNPEQLEKSDEEKLSSTGFFSPEAIDLSEAPAEIIQYILGFVNFSDLILNVNSVSKKFHQLVESDLRLVRLRNLLKEKPKAKEIFKKILENAKENPAAKNCLNSLISVLFSAPQIFKLSLALQIIDHEMGVLHNAVNIYFKWSNQLWQIKTGLKLTLACETDINSLDVSLFMDYLKGVLHVNCEKVQDDYGQYLCISSEDVNAECAIRIDKILTSGGIALGKVLTCGHYQGEMTLTAAEEFLDSPDLNPHNVTTILRTKEGFDGEPIYMISRKASGNQITHDECCFTRQLLVRIVRINEESMEPHSEAQLSLS